MTGQNEIIRTKEHINKIRDSLIAIMKTEKGSGDSSFKEEIEFLLKRL